MSVRSRTYALIFFFCSCLLAAHANQAVSREPHQGRVNALAFFSDGSVVTAGQDGFLIRWDSEGNGDHYQFADSGIKFIAANPSSMEIALFETDGFSVFRLTVFNWQTKTKKWTKDLDSDLASLTYSARGTYVLAGSTSLKGMLFFNASNGAQQNVMRDTTGIASFADTGASETSMVLYTLSGTIAYYDLRTGKLKASFMTETNLSQTVLYNNNLVLAGVKNNTVYLIDALSGSVLQKIEAREPTLITAATDQELHYITATAPGVYEYRTAGGQTGSAETFRFSGETHVSCAAKRGSSIFAASTDGMIYSITQSYYDGSIAADQVSRRERSYVIDIDSGENYTWFLTANALYWLHRETETVGKIPTDASYTNVLALDGGVLLWERGQRTPITAVSVAEDGQAELAGEEGNFNPAHNSVRLYSPTAAIQSVTVTANTLTLVEGNSTVQLIRLSDGKITGTYRGTGYQCAVLSGSTLFVGKTAVTNPKSALISINTVTGEIVMEKNTASVIYSLVADADSTLYGLAVRNTGTARATEIFSFHTGRRSISTLFSVAEEKLNAYLTMNGNMLFTNISAPNTTIIDIGRMTRTTVPRGASYAKKLISAGDYYYVLNNDGTVTSYEKAGLKQVATWAITLDGIYLIL